VPYACTSSPPLLINVVSLERHHSYIFGMMDQCELTQKDLRSKKFLHIYQLVFIGRLNYCFAAVALDIDVNMASMVLVYL